MAKSVIAHAEHAEKNKNITEAERDYEQYLQVVPDDTNTKLQYADLLAKSDNMIKQQEAIALYSTVLKQFGGRTDVRRKRMDLVYKLGLFAAVRNDLLVLLPQSIDKEDKDNIEFTSEQVELLFKMGRCCEAERDETRAESYYRAAIKNRATDRLEAYRQLASLLQRKPGQAAHDEADKLIEDMVNSDSGNYQVYLERGRYRRLQAQAKAEGQTQAEADARRSQLLTDARQDFQKAADLAPHVPEILLELAKAVATDKSGRSNARQILENGIKAAPKRPELYQALASIELEDGQLDKAITVLERGLKELPESLQLHVALAERLAQRGRTGELFVQIEELKKLGCIPTYVQYLTAYYHVNLHQYRTAQQILSHILAEMPPGSNLAVPVNLLLAQCYSRLGETQQQHDAYGRAFSEPTRETCRPSWAISTPSSSREISMVQSRDMENWLGGFLRLGSSWRNS